MLTLDCSLQQLTPHGLTVCCWEHGSSSWLSGRQKQHHAHSHRRDVEASKPSSFGTNSDTAFHATVSTGYQKRSKVRGAHLSEKMIQVKKYLT